MSETRPVGRPSKYDPAFCEKARKLCLLGATDGEMAEFFDISEATLNNWKIEYPEFLESIVAGKIIADAEVADKLYQCAIGYSHEVTKVYMPAGAKEPINRTYTERFAPDPQAARMWLMNRRGKNWTDKTKVEHSFDLESLVNASLPQSGGGDATS